MDAFFAKLSSTLPKAIRKAARLEEGDPAKVELNDDGVIDRRP